MSGWVVAAEMAGRHCVRRRRRSPHLLNPAGRRDIVHTEEPCCAESPVLRKRVNNTSPPTARWPGRRDRCEGYNRRGWNIQGDGRRPLMICDRMSIG